MKHPQLSLFDIATPEPEPKPVKPKEKLIDTFIKDDGKSIDTDYLMEWLERTNKEAEKQLQELQDMVACVQRGMTDDEKMQINNPKEYERQQKLKQQQTEPVMPKELTSEAIDTLKNSQVDGMVVRLPDGQLDRKIYVEVKDKLELIGGKWKGGKVMGFVFNEDPSELLEQIANGENRNLKKEFQFFGTPDELADRLVELANIGENHSILEPSAGQGAIVKAVHRAHPDHVVYGYELMPLNQTFLKKINGFVLDGSDFLTECETTFNRIIANPPFTKNQDIDHIKKMYSLLNSYGRLVSMSSNHWISSSNKKETEFRDWLQSVNAEVLPVDAGVFKESGTSIATSIIIINK